MEKSHQAVFFHIIWIEREAGATAAVVLSDEIGKVVVTDNPSEAASRIKISTGNVLAKLLLTCCPIRDRGGT